MLTPTPATDHAGWTWRKVGEGIMAGLFGGPLAVILWFLRGLRSITPTEVRGWMLLVVFLSCLASCIARLVLFFNHQYIHEVKRTSTNTKRSSGCSKIVPDLLSDPVIYSRCEEFNVATEKWPSVRALENVVDAIPKLEDLPSFLFASAERSLYALVFATVLMVMAWAFIVQPCRKCVYGKQAQRRHRDAMAREDDAIFGRGLGTLRKHVAAPSASVA